MVQLFCLWLVQRLLFLFTRKILLLWYWLELCNTISLFVVSIMRPILFDFMRIFLSVVSRFWNLIQLNTLGACLRRVWQELRLNIYVRRFWVGIFLKSIESILERKCWDWVYDGISGDTFSEYSSDRVYCWYIQYLILIAFWMIDRRVVGWFRTPYINLYICTKVLKYIFVFDVDNLLYRYLNFSLPL